MDNDLIYTLSAMAIGALVTWWAALRYYEKASRDLATEAKELRRLNVLMLRGLESAGFTEFSRDDEGNIKGMVHRASGNLVGDGATIGVTDTITSNEKNHSLTTSNMLGFALLTTSLQNHLVIDLITRAICKLA